MMRMTQERGTDAKKTGGERKARLAAELRANLKRRKAKSRSPAAESDDAGGQDDGRGGR